MRLLLVEDDPALGGAIRDYLTREAYVVDWATTLAAARASLSAEHGSVILDLGLPDGDGLALLPLVRRARRAGRRADPHRARPAVGPVRGLDAGADDYLVKPFDLPELSARLRAVARRRAGQSAPLIELGALSIDPAAREVRLDGVLLRLTAHEYALVMAFARHPRPRAHAAPARGSDLRARRGRRQQRRRGLRVAAAAQARPRRDQDDPRPGLPVGPPGQGAAPRRTRDARRRRLGHRGAHTQPAGGPDAAVAGRRRRQRLRAAAPHRHQVRRRDARNRRHPDVADPAHRRPADHRRRDGRHAAAGVRRPRTTASSTRCATGPDACCCARITRHRSRSTCRCAKGWPMRRRGGC